MHILLIDDNEDDRMLVRHELRREIAGLSFTEIGDKAAFDAALSKGPFQLAITDYRLFWSDGLQVFARLKERWPDLPVIMFTGTGSEQVAVAAMKAGVTDYLLKDAGSGDALRGAVKAALASRKQSDEGEADMRYRDLFDTVPVGLFKCTPSGKFLQANQALAFIAGVESQSKLLERTFPDLHPHPADFELWREKLERDGAVAFVESRFRTDSGAERWVEIHARALRDTGSGQIFYEGSVDDITQRKQAEAERDRLIAELKEAVARVKSLTGLLPICASCKRIRDESGYWNMLESYIEKHSHAHFTHSFCPECARTLYPEVFLETPKI